MVEQAIRLFSAQGGRRPDIHLIEAEYVAFAPA